MKSIEKMNFMFRLACIALFVSFVGSTSIVGQGHANRHEEESGKKTLSPYFVVISEHPETDQLPLKSTSASVNVVGVIADVTVSQKYVNTGKNNLEAIYTFPLSTRAAVYAMKMTIGKRVIHAKISEKEKARKDYNTAKSQGKRVSLLEQNRPNVFTMNVANIAVNDTIVVDLKYTELLVPENGVYSFVYPTVVGPRYSNKTASAAGPDGQFVNSPYTKKGVEPTYKFGFKMKINSAIPIQDVTCTTHKMDVKYPDLNSATVKLDKSETNGGNRDVILNYSLQGNKIESGVMLYEHGDESFFLIMAQPPKKVLTEEIPPREYIFIMDVSGSMDGFPIGISKKLLRNLIMNLRPTDKFNVVLFAGTAGLLSEKSIDATPENVERAIKMVENQHGSGGTELLTALKKAYAIPRSSENDSRSFVLLSDGYVDVEKESFEMVRNHKDNSNFFCFGIGTSVNRFLMEGLAFMGDGEPIIVDNPTIADTQAEKFRSYVSTPVLTNIKASYGSMEMYDIEPASTPDMMAERPIIIFGKYKGKPTGSITLSGETGSGRYEKSFDLSGMKANPAFSAIRYLWARERIKVLDYYKGNGSEYRFSDVDNILKNEITQLGLKYGLMTAYTSFIAIDENFRVDKDKKLVTVKQPLPLPKGVSNKAVGKIKFVPPVIKKDEEVLDEVQMKSQEELSNSNVQVSVADVTGVENRIVDIADVKEAVTMEQEEKVYTVIEQMPQFPGGETELMNIISKNLQYPKIAQENGIQGKVILRFMVDKDGTVKKVEIIRSLDPSCDKEAIRIVKALPKFIPGKQNGVNVAVWYTMPITFKLN